LLSWGQAGREKPPGDLLPRFYEPTSGAIRIDGVNIREVTIKSLREQIAMVTQENILFHDTVWNNIATG